MNTPLIYQKKSVQARKIVHGQTCVIYCCEIWDIYWLWGTKVLGGYRKISSIGFTLMSGQWRLIVDSSKNSLTLLYLLFCLGVCHLMSSLLVSTASYLFPSKIKYRLCKVEKMTSTCMLGKLIMFFLRFRFVAQNLVNFAYIRSRFIFHNRCCTGISKVNYCNYQVCLYFIL